MAEKTGAVHGPYYAAGLISSGRSRRLSASRCTLPRPIRLQRRNDFDLSVLDTVGVRPDRVDAMAKWLRSRGGAPMLLVVDEEDIAEMRLPSRLRSDFICSGAGDAELEVRARQLLGECEAVPVDEVLTVDNLTINLATYQVSLDGEPVDLTLMEYSLLSFLATHPNRAYSRQVLASRVGF